MWSRSQRNLFKGRYRESSPWKVFLIHVSALQCQILEIFFGWVGKKILPKETTQQCHYCWFANIAHKIGKSIKEIIIVLYNNTLISPFDLTSFLTQNYCTNLYLINVHTLNPMDYFLSNQRLSLLITGWLHLDWTGVVKTRIWRGNRSQGCLCGRPENSGNFQFPLISHYRHHTANRWCFRKGL